MDEEIRIKQIILAEIYDKKEISVVELSSTLNLSIEICFSYSEEIYYEGYINFIDATTFDGKDALLSLNGKGEIFFNSGGYAREQQQNSKIEKSETHQTILSNATKIITIITSIATIIFAYLTFSQRNEIDRLKGQLNKDKSIELKKELVGKWFNITGPDSSYYEFFDNNEWLFFIDNGDKNWTLKGEYQIGKKNGLFLRRYGSQHWFLDTTYVDVRSGIGASYLYIEDSILINDQEDYENKYKKLK